MVAQLAATATVGRLATTPWQVVEHIKGDTAELDSVVVRSPLPGGVAAVVRFLFNLPQWFQIWGFVAGVLVAIVVVVLLWRVRQRIVSWFLRRSRAVLVGLGAVGALVLSGVAVFSDVSWNYTQHNNNFCVACHIMTDAYQRFGTSAHQSLQCHDCHQQSLYASMMQVYYWVAERPASIPPHAKVPSAVCARCHEQGNARKTWQYVIATAGHSVHLRSDNPRLKNIQCVTCHGTELHRFVPVESTCGQSGCHAGIAIRLGKMRDQTELHCVSCHPFTTPVARQLSPDSAAQVLEPATQQCLDCHQMRRAILAFNPLEDPHRGQCGWCHNPHTQTTPAAAFTTCTTAGCHAGADTLTSMHRGLGRHVLANCGACHAAHSWKVDATACLRCHSNIFSNPSHHALVPPARTAFLSTRAVWRPIVWLAQHVIPRGAPRLMILAPDPMRRGSSSPRDSAARAAASGLPPGPDGEAHTGHELNGGTDTLPPFSHRVHRALRCTACHNSAQQHGAVLIRSIHDCQACHHAATQQKTCDQCHVPESLARQFLVRTVVRASVLETPQVRDLPFRHVQHDTIACRTCHTAPVTLAPRSCTDCHVSHHQVADECIACHHPVLTTHTRAAHLGCGGEGCHTDAAVAVLPPARNVCLVCHEQQVAHYLGRDCATCHAVSWTAVAERSRVGAP